MNVHNVQKRPFQEKLTPISGVMELPLPKTLHDGCKSICSKKDHLFGKIFVELKNRPENLEVVEGEVELFGCNML